MPIFRPTVKRKIVKMKKNGELQTIIIVALLSMIGPFAIDSIFPAFARIGVQYDVPDAALQQIISVYLLSYAVASLIHGPISDAVGRKPIMIVGLSAFGVASVGCALAPNLGVLLAFRAAQGAFAGSAQIISRALIRDLYVGSKAQKVMAQVSMIFSLTPALAPIIGGWLLTLGNWRTIFVFLTFYILFLLLLVIFRLPESHPAERRTPLRLKPVFVNLAKVSSNLPFMRLALASAITFGAQFVYITGAPILIVRLLGLGERDFWVFFIPLIVGMMLGSFTNSRLAEFAKPTKVATAGLIIVLIAAIINILLALSPVSGALPWVVLAPALMAFGNSLTFPILQLQMLDLFPQMRGSAASVQSFVTLLLDAVIAGLLVPMVSGSVLTFALASGCLGLISALLWTWHLIAAQRKAV